MANRLADIPQLTEAVAKRISSSDLHEGRCRTWGRSSTAPWSRTSKRTPCGSTTARCSTAQSRPSTPASTSPPTGNARPPRSWAASSSGSTLSSTRSPPAARPEPRSCASLARCATVHERGQDFAAGIWVVDPAFMLDLAHGQLGNGDSGPAREEAYFAGARLDDDELREAAAEDEARRPPRASSPACSGRGLPPGRSRHGQT